MVFLNWLGLSYAETVGYKITLNCGMQNLRDDSYSKKLNPKKKTRRFQWFT